jgi:hypothetical protein
MRINYPGTIALILILISCKEKKREPQLPNLPFRDTISTEILKNTKVCYTMPETYLDSVRFDFGTIAPGSKTYIYNSSTKLFKDSLLNIPFEFTLSKQDEISICYPLNKKVIVGSYANDIYYVKATNDGKEYFGYIAENQLSLVWKQLSKDYTIYLSIRECLNTNNIKRPMANVSLYKNSAFVNEITIEPVYQSEGSIDTIDFYYCLSSSLVSDCKMIGIKSLIKIDSYYPACGYSSGENILLFDGQKIYYGLNTLNYFDAGIVANYTYINAPEDTSLQKKHLFLTINHVEYAENSDEVSLHDSLVLDYELTQDNKLIFKDTITNIKLK